MGDPASGPIRWEVAASTWRLPVRRLLTATVRPVMVRRSIRAAQLKPINLHLGSGSTLLEGWTNIDLIGRNRADIVLDVRKRLPFASGSADAIFSEHMLEHLTYEDATWLVSECARVLGPGGVVRLVTPDFGRYARAYVRGDEFVAATGRGRMTPLMALAEVAYGYGHRSIWDAETLVALMEYFGLHATENSLGASRLDPCPDTAARRDESLYVEGWKDDAAQ